MRRLLARFKAGLATVLLAQILLLGACGGGSGGGSGGTTGSSPSTPSPSGEPVPYSAASRFLDQASFGAKPSTIAKVQKIGMNAFIDEQIAARSSGYDDPGSTDTLDTVRTRFFSNAVNGDDQLRQRVAFALSQIFVVSTRQINDPTAMVQFQRVLLAGALGNYYDLLRNVTLSPVMGAYLDMVNNVKADPANGTVPNENFAREVLQLFSIGTDLLNEDGTLMRDGNGMSIPSYSQAVVEDYAKAFTGWTYPTKPGSTPKAINYSYFVGQMIPSETNHDTGEKVLLNGVTLPAGQSAEQDLTAALQSIFNHPNVGPFIGFRLIQHLVTSNPSPDYVRRVAGVFDNNGKGVRGDLAAVVKAILLDSEARRNDTPGLAQATDGKLKEPILMIVGLLRSLNASTKGAGLNHYAELMGQEPFSALSVFSYYPPSHRIASNQLYGPEFNIHNNPAILTRINFILVALFGYLTDGTVIDMTEWTALAADNDALLDAVNLRLLNGTMSAAMRASLSADLNLLNNTTAEYRARAALSLAAASSQYFIQQ